MKQLLPPVPYNTPVTGQNSLLSVPWAGFFRQLSKGLINLRGTDSNDSADTGYVGEYVSSNPAAPVSVGASASYKNITSISLSPGDWDVSGTVAIDPGTGTSFSLIAGGVSLTSGTQDASNNGGVTDLPANGANIVFGCLSPRRISVSVTTTVYLVGFAAYATAGTAAWTVNSIIRARRVR